MNTTSFLPTTQRTSSLNPPRRRSTLLGLLAMLALVTQPAVATERAAPAMPKRPLVQIAILLDTSNSMDGLIEQAKSQLWKISNEFIKARQAGVAPEVQIALYEYGKSTLAAESGCIRRILPLTNDLDRVSEELFALQTNGGEEYCGWVIQQAVNELEWSPAADVYKAVFIAGNEPFTQGPVKYAGSCKAAIARGILVNTIHCGPEAQGVNTQWRDGADLADGKFLVIDHNQAVVSIAAPQDKEIARLGVELNDTYLAYGRRGGESLRRQTRQDANAASLAPASGATVQRSIAKASPNYRNSAWDLVDAAKEPDFDLAKLKAEELPIEMQKMNEAERKDHVAKHAEARAELQSRIKQLNAERERFVAQRQKEAAATNTLDTAVITAIRAQASRHHFSFDSGAR